MPPKRARGSTGNPPPKRKRTQTNQNNGIVLPVTSPTQFVFCFKCGSSATRDRNRYKCDNDECGVFFSEPAPVGYINAVDIPLADTADTPAIPLAVTADTPAIPLAVTVNTPAIPLAVTVNTPAIPLAVTVNTPACPPLQLIFPKTKERNVAAAILRNHPNSTEAYLRNAVRTVFDHGPVGGKKNCAECRKTKDGSKCPGHIRKCKCGARFDSRDEFRFHKRVMGQVSSTISARRNGVFTSSEAMPGTISKYDVLLSG